MDSEENLAEFLEIAPGFYATKEFVEKMMKHTRLAEEYEKRVKEVGNVLGEWHTTGSSV